MIPYRDDNPTRRFPVITVIIIAANVLVFLYQQTLPEGGAFIYGAVPGHILHGHNYGLPMKEPAWITIFTSMFMHGGWLHLLGNILFLWIFGDNIEDLMGSVRFIFFYLLCGLAAAGLQLAMSTTGKALMIPMVGASGAIAGVLGAYLIKFPQARIRTLLFWCIIIQVVTLPAWVMLGLWLLFQFFSATSSTLVGGAVGGVAFFAHVGGFIAGMILVNLFSIGRQKPRPRLEYYDDRY
jgi:membrane associated rhomboid family serine protease